MKNQTDQETGRECEALRNELAARGLDVGAIWQGAPAGTRADAARLRQICNWVHAYTACPDRVQLERQGYVYPPVEPDIDPDSDWVRFERWMCGVPVDWNYVEDFGPLAPPETLTDAQIDVKLAEVADLLATRGVVLDFQDGVAPRLVYRYLRTELRESRFEYLAPAAVCQVTGCTGDCAGCFQRPWCPMAEEAAALDDEDALVCLAR